MKRALLISIHPEWAEKILNGKKTIEIRTWIPKDYVGWVYVVITKGKPYLSYNLKLGNFGTLTEKELNSVWYNVKTFNGEVAFRFWYEKVERIYWTNDEISLPRTETNGVIKFAQKTCLLVPELEKYLNGKVGYAWHIDSLEVFDKPKELREFIHYRRETIYCGMDCPPYTDWVEYPVRKAPQKCAWVYIDEKPEPHQVSVLDEETPSEKDESERKPF